MSRQTALERREKPRLDIELSCVVQPRGKRPEKVLGQTVNLSRSGVLLDWPAANGHPTPELGEMLDIDILLAVPPEFGERSISCQAVVIRVEPRMASYLVAAKIRQFSVGLFGLIMKDRRVERAARAC